MTKFYKYFFIFSKKIKIGIQALKAKGNQRTEIQIAKSCNWQNNQIRDCL